MQTRLITEPNKIHPRKFQMEYALFGILLAVAVFGMMVLVITLGYQFWYAGRIFPGVQVAGIPVGGLTVADARDKIESTLTIWQWLRGETLSPQDPEDLSRIADILEMDFVRQYYKWV